MAPRGVSWTMLLAVASALSGCAANYHPLSPGGEACVHRCEVAFFQCSQGGGGVWAAPVCGPSEQSCLAACPDVVPVWGPPLT